MTIFGDISKLAQNEAALGVLALGSLFAGGCSTSSIPESHALDSRAAAVSSENINSLKIPGIDYVRIGLSLPEGAGRVELERGRSYGIEIPFGAHYELINAHQYLSGVFTGSRSVLMMHWCF